MEKGHKAWLILEQEYTGENEPDGNGNWIPKVITRTIAGTEDADCLNRALAAMQEYAGEVSEERAALTIIRSDKVGEIVPTELAKVLSASEGSSLLDDILNGD